ncbi:hypothetical protein ACIPYS_27550 [Kitasatospora sp. NPDC089913]
MALRKLSGDLDCLRVVRVPAGVWGSYYRNIAQTHATPFADYWR